MVQTFLPEWNKNLPPTSCLWHTKAWILLLLLRNGQLLPMKDAYKLAIDAFDILVKEKTLGRINVPVGHRGETKSDVSRSAHPV